MQLIADGRILHKKDIQDKFNISLETVNNWIKTGVIPPPEMSGYTQEAFASLVRTVEESTGKLTGRANRSYQNEKKIVFLGIKEKERRNILISLVENYKCSHLSLMQAVASVGKQMLINNDLYKEDSDIYKKINLAVGKGLKKADEDASFFSSIHIENKNDDILGAFYQSVKSIASKAKSGAFYTPKELLETIKIPENAKVLDPCCGSGSILLNTLSKHHNPSNIYAFDIDEIALLICHINLVLFFGDANIAPHIEQHDLLFEEDDLFSYNAGDKSSRGSPLFDVIITNPPWGAKLTRSQKESLRLNYPVLDTKEVFSIALYKCILKLSRKGELTFFLPEAILNVSAHRNIRRFLLECKRNIEIVPLGAAFEGVQSECILLHLSAECDSKTDISVRAEKNYLLQKIQAPDYLISYMATEMDQAILNKMYSHASTRLTNDTKFALGIVTGCNKKYIRYAKIKDDKEGEEPILRGTDISAYKLKSPEAFIRFTPEVFQQVAPIEIYRAKKIVYRFICEKIICAMDEGHLVLNSANIIISESYPMEVLACLFNSPIYTFIYQKKFKSKKLLRQHIQDFPLPTLSRDLVKNFLSVYDDIMIGRKTQKDADKLICSYFKISDWEYNYIKESVYGTT